MQQDSEYEQIRISIGEREREMQVKNCLVKIIDPFPPFFHLAKKKKGEVHFSRQNKKYTKKKSLYIYKLVDSFFVFFLNNKIQIKK